MLNKPSDNAVANRLLVKQLEKHQLVVTATTNGQEAVEREHCRLLDRLAARH
jgi:CheY-like chemotaxis protein